MMESPLFASLKMLTQILKRKQYRICTAESCTGGKLAELLTEFSGSSTWFESGFVTYSNTAKIDLLEVSKLTIAEHGAVSFEVAKAMALGALVKSHADIAIAITGIAGPTGGTDEKPVGTVYICWILKNGRDEITKRFHFKGDRAAIRQQSCHTAIDNLLNLLDS